MLIWATGGFSWPVLIWWSYNLAEGSWRVLEWSIVLGTLAVQVCVSLSKAVTQNASHPRDQGFCISLSNRTPSWGSYIVYTHLSIYLPIYLSIHLSVYLSIYLPSCIPLDGPTSGCDPAPVDLSWKSTMMTHGVDGRPLHTLFKLYIFFKGF